MKARALREEQVDAERIVLATESALNADAHLLSDAECAAVIHLIEQVRLKAQGDDADAIRDAVSALASGTDEFAARRMDRSVRIALTGKTLDQVS